MSADALTRSSRDFYERTKAKMFISIVLGGASLLLIGACSTSGGLSAAEGDREANTNGDDGIHQALKSGYGELFFPA